MKKTLLTILGTFLLIPQVNAMSFKDDNNLYILKERNITCTDGYYFYDLDKNNDLIFADNDSTNILDIIKVNKNNECVEMTLQEKYDFWNTPEVYYELYGGGLQIDSNDEEYVIKEHKNYLYFNALIKTTDAEINPEKTYVIYNSEHNSETDVTTPKKEELNTYYERYKLVLPKTTKLDKNLTYYKNISGLIYEKVENPKESEIDKYYIIPNYNLNETKTLDIKINQEKYKEILKTYGNVFVSKDKENNNFYITSLTKLLDDETDFDMLYSVYTPEGNPVGPFKEINDFSTYHNSLFGITTKEGLKIYNNKYELIYTNKDIYYLYEYGYYNDTYIMESWNRTNSSSTIYEMKVYKLTTEDNQIYKNKDLEFTSNKELPENLKITINDKELDEKNYTIENNKLIVNKEYLSTLDKGTYTLKLNYSNDEYLTTTFTIPSNIINNPSTYDGIYTHIIIALLSLVTIIVIIIYQKTSKKELN